MSSTQTAIDMGRGMHIAMSDEGDGRWKLDFDKPAPALDAIQVEAIGRNGQCHAMKMFPGPSDSEVYASGPTEKAYRARITVSHGDHTHRRDVRVPDTADYPLTTGTHGGTLISMGHDSFVEILPQGDDRWKITFLDKEVLTRVPPVADVKAEAIGAPTEDEQVRELAVLPGDDAHSLLLRGKVAGADYLRLAVMMGDHYHTRCVPVVRP
jgi:hypothetical protein